MFSLIRPKFLLLIVVLHVLFLMLFTHRQSPKPLRLQPIFVETITLAPPPPPPPPKQKPRPKAKPKPKKKKRVVKKSVPAPPRPVVCDYPQKLVDHLQLLLRLPEEGEVKIALTLGRSGKVEYVEVLRCESPLNREYVEKRLPILAFQPFGRNFGTEAKHTFQLVLQGENG